VRKLWKEQLAELRRNTKLSKSNAPLLYPEGFQIPTRELELNISGAKALIRILRRVWRGY